MSESQIKFAQNRKSSDRLTFTLTDYESFNPGKTFDRIYSIGMVEHIGLGLLKGYFAKIDELMAPDGRALVHCIVRRRQGSTNRWIDKEVFPGAYIPSLPDIIEHIDGSPLRIESIFTHNENNYFRTLQLWSANFYKNEDALKHILCEVFPAKTPTRS